MQHRVDVVEAPQADEASSWEAENLREPFAGEATPDDHLAAQLEQSRLQFKRLASDFSNMRRRTQAERSRTILYANEALLRQLLPIVDDLRLGLGPNPGKTADALAEGGLRMVLNRLERTLSSQGLRQIDPVGATFDPALHEAVGVRSDMSVPAGTVLETVRIGYSLHGKLIRAAQVVVSPLSNGPQHQPRGSVGEETQRLDPLVEQTAPEQVVRSGGSLVIEEELLEELEALSLGDLIPPE